MDVGRLTELIDAAERGEPVLTPSVLSITGFSTNKVRRLLNALCSEPDVNYLEIGVHLGSTFIPALYGNKARATCIDNWSLFGNLRKQFEANLQAHLPGREVNLIEADCFKVDLSRIPSGVNVYFYDGDHGMQSQRMALTYFASVLADDFVWVIDDMNWPEPRAGTERALKDTGYRVEYSIVLPGPYNGGDPKQWWNGLYVGLVHKT